MLLQKKSKKLPPILRFPAKAIRSKVIKQYMEEAGYKRAVCFSCGNASRELKMAGVNTIDISPTGDLVANRWWTPGEVHNVFPDAFDATSGHLPLHLMIKIGEAFKEHLGFLPGKVYSVPSGSGETILCLRMVYPMLEFIAVYDDTDPATGFSAKAPLNRAVNALCRVLHREVI